MFHDMGLIHQYSSLVRNWNDATAFVVLNKIDGGDELRNRCVSWEGECMRVRGA
jgi:hypothetical protein